MANWLLVLTAFTKEQAVPRNPIAASNYQFHSIESTHTVYKTCMQKSNGHTIKINKYYEDEVGDDSWARRWNVCSNVIWYLLAYNVCLRFHIVEFTNVQPSFKCLLFAADVSFLGSYGNRLEPKFCFCLAILDIKNGLRA